MPGQHALLSPSSTHRWLNCPPSAKLCAAQEETTSVYAKQGTDAHELCQHKLEKALGLDTTDPTAPHLLRCGNGGLCMRLRFLRHGYRMNRASLIAQPTFYTLHLQIVLLRFHQHYLFTLCPFTLYFLQRIIQNT